MHPFRELAGEYRQMIETERRTWGKWANTEKIAKWRAEAVRLERLAHVDRLNGNPNGDPR